MATIVSKPCPQCRQVVAFEVTEDCYQRYLEWKKPGSDLIQNLLPELDHTQRERLMTGYCDPCWKELFAGEEEALP